MLHVTNGDSTVRLLREADLGGSGEILPWRDVLHDGPVPAELSEAELDEVRARFIADQGWAPYEEVRAGFAARWATLRAADAEDEIVLWFEHDLYDQLQLAQLLSWFSYRPDFIPRVSLVCIGAHPRVERFLGLGQLQPQDLASLFTDRRPVSSSQLELGRRAWAAFRSPDPTAIEELLAADTGALPFLAAALHRHLEQFPATGTGLARTEHQILEVVSSGVRRLDRVFLATQEMEAAPFLGDASFWLYLGSLCSGEHPLLRTRDGQPLGSPGEAAERAREVEVTSWGDAVRRGGEDWIRLRGGIDRWLGGVHLDGPEPAWRWDADGGRLTPSGE